MRINKYLLITTLSIIFISCGQNSTTNKDNLNKETHPPTQIDKDTSFVEVQTDETKNEEVEAKYLITNNSVGNIKIGGPWQKSVKLDYDYEVHQGFGSCGDGCCDGGFGLGKKLIVTDWGWVENPEIIIGALLFEDAELFDDEKNKNKYKNNKNVFYSSSDNCSGWYWKDKVNYVLIFSEVFKTKEGIGVGTTLEKMKETFGNVVINVGWIEEDPNAIRVKVNSYPNIKFIIDVDDAVGGYENFNPEGESAKISDFKKNTKIRRIIVSKHTN